VWDSGSRGTVTAHWEWGVTVTVFATKPRQTVDKALSTMVVKAQIPHVPEFFQQAQTSIALHRKLLIQLHKGHKKVAGDLNKEDDFTQQFILCINRVLGVKKRSAEIKRIDMFITNYIRFIQEKGLFSMVDVMVKPLMIRFLFTESNLDEGTSVDDDESEETFVDRFVEKLIKHLLCGFEAKDKAVRVRVCQLISMIMDSLSELE
jgi:condensin complex subunit 3